MKLIRLLIALAFVSGIAQAQKIKPEDVPLAVKKSFSERFSSITKIKWEKEETAFEASFEIQNKELTASYDAAGNWLETETQIKESALPSSVKAILSKDYIDYKVAETELVELPGKEPFYELEVEKGKMKYDLQFSVDGKVLKKEEKKEKR